MLYDDTDQLEVRHVISLAHYETDIYGGGEEIPEGELFVKRNCIRMSPKPPMGTLSSDNLPFYLFSNNCSEKEDFYHVMLQNQGRDGGSVPAPLAFNREDMVKLIRQLHASEDNLQTRWLNALVGRVFLSMYKTSVVEQLVRNKISKKLSRVAKPAMITAIQLRGMHLGDGAPLITAPKLRELTRDGDLTLEADVKYKGGIRVDIAIIARIDLGQRFKAREVELLLAVVCKSLEGRMVFRMKPPPSNRIWFAFETMPKMDLLLEPVISSRQITYALILRTIESKLREVIKDTLVLPNWDDVQFADTLNHPVRGGLWEHDSSDAMNEQLSTAPTPAQGGEAIQMQDDDLSTEIADSRSSVEPTEPVPTVTIPNATVSRKNRLSSPGRTEATSEAAVSTSLDLYPQSVQRGIRSNSFASVAIPIVSREQAVMDSQTEPKQSGQSATSTMKDKSSRSRPGTPSDSPLGPPSPKGMRQKQSNWRGLHGSGRADDDVLSKIQEHFGVAAAEPTMKISSTVKEPESTSVVEHSKDAQKPDGLSKRQTIASTAAAAKKWGLDFVTRHAPNVPLPTINGEAKKGDDDSHSVAQLKHFSSLSSKDTHGMKSEPMGRGQPLPPPGQPLPNPRSNRMAWTSMLGRKTAAADHSRPADVVDVKQSPANSPQRMSVANDVASTPPPAQQILHSPGIDGLSKGSSIPRPVKRTPPYRRETPSGENNDDIDEYDGVLVIKAPESEPEQASPLARSHHNGSEYTPSDGRNSRLEQDVGSFPLRDEISHHIATLPRPPPISASVTGSTSPSAQSDPANYSPRFAPKHGLTTSRSEPLLSISLYPSPPSFASDPAMAPSPSLKTRLRKSQIPTTKRSHSRSPVTTAATDEIGNTMS
jgi:hypothetical protein